MKDSNIYSFIIRVLRNIQRITNHDILAEILDYLSGSNFRVDYEIAMFESYPSVLLIITDSDKYQNREEENK